jgi:hypothetical protein
MTSSAIIATVAAVLVVIATLDGRSTRARRKQRFSYRNSTWQTVLHDINSTGWFVRELRVSRTAFQFISERVSDKWTLLFKNIGPNARFKIKDRVAIALHYFTHESNQLGFGLVAAIETISAINITQFKQDFD